MMFQDQKRMAIVKIKVTDRNREWDRDREEEKRF